jgi:hypothetical protein
MVQRSSSRARSSSVMFTPARRTLARVPPRSIVIVRPSSMPMTRTMAASADTDQRSVMTKMIDFIASFGCGGAAHDARPVWSAQNST